MTKKKSANTMWGGHYDMGPADAFAAINPSIAIDQRLYAEDIQGSLAHAAMLAGLVELDGGEMFARPRTTVAYLPQEVSIELGSRSLFTEAESAFDEILAQQEELDRVSEELALVDEMLAVADRARGRSVAGRPVAGLGRRGPGERAGRSGGASHPLDHLLVRGDRKSVV